MGERIETGRIEAFSDGVFANGVVVLLAFVAPRVAAFGFLVISLRILFVRGGSAGPTPASA